MINFKNLNIFHDGVKTWLKNVGNFDESSSKIFDTNFLLEQNSLTTFLSLT